MAQICTVRPLHTVSTNIQVYFFSKLITQLVLKFFKKAFKMSQNLEGIEACKRNLVEVKRKVSLFTVAT